MRNIRFVYENVRYDARYHLAKGVHYMYLSFFFKKAKVSCISSEREREREVNKMKTKKHLPHLGHSCDCVV